MKIREKYSNWWDNNAWSCYGNFSQLWRKYMWSAENVLPNSAKISDLTKREVFFSSLRLDLMQNSDKTAGVQVSEVFGTREHVDSGGMF